ncbi:N-acetyltransferase GCN5 [Fulvitalea axinellae]|uniref:N-acetyltransferase GCN5 n=1 Tax=Fulvitalea axinellae TaxID=1182444 RepID=A0AAU9D549_9BACT|nr:N-acetyltransferase GCN5 [Fulvitalea axinellae]
MPQTKTFETERLYLIPTAEDDAEFIFRLMNSPKYHEYIGDRNIRTLDDAKTFIQEKMTLQLLRLGYSSYTLVRKSDGEKVGVCGLYDREGLEGVDIGFALLPEFERTGYALESALKLKQMAFAEFNISEIKAITTKENKASQTLLEKLGLKAEGTVVLPGTTNEMLLYRLKNESA